ncbi:MAG: T9SS type A sorting domain-containing protein [Bacteroidales bacterium]|nr:T9SS type A sorting domain-containing protein [Bacteroidales bacterium]
MKRISYFIALILGSISLSLFGQSTRIQLPEKYCNMALPVNKLIQADHSTHLIGTKDSKTIPLNTPEETDIGETMYDLQTNHSMQNRYVVYPDNFEAAVWNYGMDQPMFPDRGSGYNSFDGDNWNSFPGGRIESERAGWPSYAPWGAEGEIVCAHLTGNENVGLMINKREQKGTGEWEESLFQGPEGHEDVLWPRLITSGTNHEIIHLIYLTRPVTNGGSHYQGLDGALLYSCSTDGGETWEIKDQIVQGLGADFYTGFREDTYCWLEPQDDNIAFLVGDDWTDLVLLKSTDNGSTWNQSVIWNHPYPMFDLENPTATDTFYCNDGAVHGAFDSGGKVHVVFGINRACSDGEETSWFPFVDGLAYWNEDDEEFNAGGDNLDALNPYDDPDSELQEGDNLIGWVPDLNENGVWVEDLVCNMPDCIGLYNLGASSMPQMMIDDNDVIHVVFSAVCEVFSTSGRNYRHLFYTHSYNGSIWPTGDFVWLTENPVHTFDECVYPSIASSSADNKLHLIYQRDDEPGLAVLQHNYTMNTITAMKKWLDNYLPPPDSLEVSMEENNAVLSWTPPPKKEELGYNVYRNNEIINETLIIETTYTDYDLEAGTYEYYVTAVYSCGESGPSNVVMVVAPGMKERKRDDLNIFPVPATEALIVSSRSKINSVRLLNNVGQLILASSVKDSQYKLDVSHLDAGIYIIEIQSTNKVITKKVVIE